MLPLSSLGKGWKHVHRMARIYLIRKVEIKLPI